MAQAAFGLCSALPEAQPPFRMLQGLWGLGFTDPGFGRRQLEAFVTAVLAWKSPRVTLSFQQHPGGTCTPSAFRIFLLRRWRFLGVPVFRVSFTGSRDPSGLGERNGQKEDDCFMTARCGTASSSDLNGSNQSLNFKFHTPNPQFESCMNPAEPQEARSV